MVINACWNVFAVIKPDCNRRASTAGLQHFWPRMHIFENQVTVN